MPFIHSPGAMLRRPDGLDDEGLAGGNTSECVYGFFGTTTVEAKSLEPHGGLRTKVLPTGLTMLLSGGMGCCSAVFMLCVADRDHAFGAVVHFDNTGEPGEIFRAILAEKHISPHAAINARTWVVTNCGTDMTGVGAYRSLLEAGFVNPQQFVHAGAAAMDSLGNIFDPYM